jgi:hypothetical protein
MRRILLNDEDAATFHFIEWQAHLHTADFAISEFLRFDHAVEPRQGARIAKDKAEDILFLRFKAPAYAFLGIDELAKEAARARHNLRAVILQRAWEHAFKTNPEERAYEIMMEPEVYALRRSQQGLT